MCPVPQIPRTVSLLGPSPLNAGRVLQAALYNPKYTHLLPNAAGIGGGGGGETRGGPVIEEMFSPIMKIFNMVNTVAIRETFQFLKFKSWPI